ncbi:prolyl-tRNA synthetase [Sparganum proliferum]
MMPRFTKVSKLLRQATPIVAEHEKGLLSHRLFMHNGILATSSPGIFVMSPVALRAVEKLSSFISHKMTSIGGQKCLFPTLGVADLWSRSGRWQRFGNEMFTLKDRNGGSFCLQPTHEEEVCCFVRKLELPRPALPLLIFQISSKFRDEMRPRLGLLRSKEFLMKDMYSFDLDSSSARSTYEVVCQCYGEIFTELGLPFCKLPASGGLMGDCPSYEFQVPLPEGEDSLIWCPRCLKGEPLDSSFEHSRQPQAVCHECGSTMQQSNSVEVGHCFLLGTSYTSCFDVSVATPQETIPLHMGCYGIGITRLLGTAVEYFTRKANENFPDELRWPRGFAPFSGAIALQKANAKDAISGENLAFLLSCLSDYPSANPTGTTYHAGLLPQGDILLDDRDKLSIGRKLLDLRRLGVPWIVVAKNKKDMNFGHELLDVYTGTSYEASVEDIRRAFTRSDFDVDKLQRWRRTTA